MEHGLARLIAQLTPEKQAAQEAAIREFEEAQSRITIRGPRISPFNQGRWPTPEEQAARLEQVREQLRRMKRKNPSLYKSLPLLHELLEGEE